MHELSLAIAIVELVERYARGRAASVVTVRVGAMRQVVPRSLAFQFELAARGSVCEGATLVQEPIPALLRCNDCGSEWDPAPPSAATRVELLVSFRCTACGSTRFEVARGEELEVDSIEVAEAGLDLPTSERERCIAPR
ncbi:MAG TPA: hydrogenase maturation nickel metallochaperone HypA [Solirubrobacterales bacterium]